MILALVNDKIIGIGTISSNQKKKCGFEIEGVLKNETYIDEEFFNIVCMGMIL